MYAAMSSDRKLVALYNDTWNNMKKLLGDHYATSRCADEAMLKVDRKENDATVSQMNQNDANSIKKFQDIHRFLSAAVYKASKKKEECERLLRSMNQLNDIDQLKKIHNEIDEAAQTVLKYYTESRRASMSMTTPEQQLQTKETDQQTEETGSIETAQTDDFQPPLTSLEPIVPQKTSSTNLLGNGKIQALIGAVVLAASAGMSYVQRREKEKQILTKLRAVAKNTTKVQAETANMVFGLIKKMNPQAVAKHGVQLLAIAVVIGGLIQYWEIIKSRFLTWAHKMNIKNIRMADLSDYTSMSSTKLQSTFVNLVRTLTNRSPPSSRNPSKVNSSPSRSPNRSKSKSKQTRSKSKKSKSISRI